MSCNNEAGSDTSTQLEIQAGTGTRPRKQMHGHRKVHYEPNFSLLGARNHKKGDSGLKMDELFWGGFQSPKWPNIAD